MKTLLTTIALILLSSSNVLASLSQRQDNSGVIVWIFLGFCGLIVSLQLVPSILMFLGMVKGLKTPTLDEVK